MALEKIAWYSFPSNHLLNFQLLKNIDNVDSLKPLYFGMVSLIPGVKDNNSRTYDYSQAVHVKYNLHELEGLAFALKQYAVGNTQHLNYVKFTNSNNTSKVVTLLVGSEKQQVKNEEIINRVIAINVSSNNSGKRVQLSCDQAHSMGETIHQLYLIGCQNEFSREVNTDSYNKTSGSKQSSFSNQPSNTGGGAFGNVAEDEDDNSSFLGGNFNGGNPFS